MKTLTVGLVGLGYFSQFHLSGWQALPEAKLIALCDRDVARAQDHAAHIGAEAFADPAEMAARHRPDIVDIITPPVAHASVLDAVMAPGRVVICQKPFCTSLAEARAQIIRARDMGCTLVIHENFRFQPWHRAIKAFLDSGRMGQVFQARFDLRPGDGRGKDAYLARQPAFQTMERLLIHETGVHFIDLFRWLFGDIETVYADLKRLNPVIRGEDAGVMMLTHEGGVTSLFDGNRLSDHVTDNPRRTMGEMFIEGEGGTITLDRAGVVRFRAFGSVESDPLPLPGPYDDASFGGGCSEALIRHVVQAMQTGQPIENTASEYMHVMQVSAAAYHSDQTGQRVAVSEFLPISET